MIIHAIDPGNQMSAWVRWDGVRVLSFSNHVDNEALLHTLEAQPFDHSTILVLEQVKGFGLRAGETLFETCFWTGRLFQAWQGVADRIGRVEVKRILCGRSNANDADVREAITHRFGGTKEKAFGSKKAGEGPLYGLAGDGISALAVALAYEEKMLGRGHE